MATPKQEKLEDPYELTPKDSVDSIPPQLRGLPSGMLREMPELGEVSEEALVKLEQEEAERENLKAEQLKLARERLPETIKSQCPGFDAAANEEVVRRVQKGDFDGLSPMEAWVLGKMNTAYIEQKAKHPDKPAALKLANPTDQMVLGNFKGQTALDKAFSAVRQEETRELDELRKKFGLKPEGSPQEKKPATAEKAVTGAASPEAKKGAGETVKKEGTAADVEKLFAGFGGAFREGAKRKMMEYNERILNALGGNPKRGDTIEQLKRDFKQVSGGKEWTEGFFDTKEAKAESPKATQDEAYELTEKDLVKDKKPATAEKAVAGPEAKAEQAGKPSLTDYLEGKIDTESLLSGMGRTSEAQRGIEEGLLEELKAQYQEGKDSGEGFTLDLTGFSQKSSRGLRNLIREALPGLYGSDLHKSKKMFIIE